MMTQIATAELRCGNAAETAAEAAADNEAKTYACGGEPRSSRPRVRRPAATWPGAFRRSTTRRASASPQRVIPWITSSCCTTARVALSVTVPGEIPVTRPSAPLALETAAWAASDEDQIALAVRSWAVLSL